MSTPTITDVPPETVLRTEARPDEVPADASAPVAPSAHEDGALQFTVRFAVHTMAPVPVQATGVLEVAVARPGGSSPALRELWRPLFGPPSILGISPPAGPISGGTPVNINGSGFLMATGVSFGPQPAASFSIKSDSLIVAISPGVSSPRTVDIRVSNPAGTSALGPQDKFTYT